MFSLGHSRKGTAAGLSGLVLVTLLYDKYNTERDCEGEESELELFHIFCLHA